jgi:predicted nucleic acid-binding protein
MSSRVVADPVIVDASAMVDLLVGSGPAGTIEARLRGHELHVPAHFDAEVLSTLAHLQRAGHITDRQAKARLQRVAAAPIQRHLLAPLLAGAWKLRDNVRLVDALYVELASQLDASVVTTDAGLAAASPVVDLVADDI